MADRDVVYIVSWMYSDKSGFGMVRAFDMKEEADDLCKLLAEQTDNTRQFCVDTVRIVRNYS